MKNAISPTRTENYPEWYQQVIKAADLAENSPVRGCMVIKPWGYGIWERIQSELDARIKATGHVNAYFPLFIPLNFLEKEATHVEGFATECAVVTHHRLELKDGKLVPTGELEEPYIVRPTSETIIGASFSKWIQSYRDLPLLINQWANVVRWEMRTRLFLRTAEFLWQEGHTAHASKEEAIEETWKMLEVYRELAEDILAIPVIVGEKPEHERFPGADMSVCIEAMMQDRKALQAGTSHFLGQNFAKAMDIKFLDKDGSTQLAFTTSWGASTRLIGALIMTHSDDDGLRVPPRVAPHHIVIMPITPKPETAESVIKYADTVASSLKGLNYHGRSIEVIVDKRDIRGGEKNWQWIKKGIPIRIEVGPRDMENGSVALSRRDRPPKDKDFINHADLAEKICAILDEIQANYYSAAKQYQTEYLLDNIVNFEEFKKVFTPLNEADPEIHGAFVQAPWCEQSKCADVLAELKVTIRCLLLEHNQDSKSCVLCGKKSKRMAIFAKSY